MINKNNVISLSDEELKICYNELMKRYRKKNQNNIKEYNKKYNAKRYYRKSSPMDKRYYRKNEEENKKSLNNESSGDLDIF